MLALLLLTAKVEKVLETKEDITKITKKVPKYLEVSTSFSTFAPK